MKNGKTAENGKRRAKNAAGIFRSSFSAACPSLSSFSASQSFSFVIVFLCCFSFLTACASLEKPKPEPFYSNAAPPPQKEFRWSNGGRLPKSFDPAQAAAAPETDAVRALFEGLTDTDARTLKTVPAIAVDWSSADENRTWIFKLRRDAKWSNGEPLTANDFVRSWKRLAALGARVPHFKLLSNIAGMKKAGASENNQAELDLFSQNNLKPNLTVPPIFKPNSDDAETKPEANLQTAESQIATANDDAAAATHKDAITGNNKRDESKKKPAVKDEIAFGAVAVDDFTLKVSLVEPDKDFPALVAHPVFRPVFADGKSLETGKLNNDIVTSGAFRVKSVSPIDGVTLERSESFWGKNQIQLERVRFVPTANAERALEAYRAGEIDAVTNHDFEPLALKLLTPFDDFRRTAHGALNFYEFNRARAPFDDRRVREALTIAVERERLTQDEMDGASVPALGFLPFADEKNLNFSQNVERAKNLFAAAGYADGEDFPVVRLVVNRNNVQQKIARAVAKMWKQNLNVETEIVVRETAEIEAARQTGDYDVLRRGAIFATTDEAVNMQMIFAAENQSKKTSGEKDSANKTVEENKNADELNRRTDSASLQSSTQNTNGAAESQTSGDSVAPELTVESAEPRRPITTEADAMSEFAAVPLYFPTAFSLVKPYVRGFESNTLDAPSLKDVSIDNEWKAK